MADIKYLNQYCKNIDECSSEVEKIKELKDFNSYSSMINNGLKLGRLIYDRLKLDGDIIWTGSQVKSKYPFDIMIGDKGISLKQGSFILKTHHLQTT